MSDARPTTPLTRELVDEPSSVSILCSHPVVEAFFGQLSTTARGEENSEYLYTNVPQMSGDASATSIMPVAGNPEADDAGKSRKLLAIDSRFLIAPGHTEKQLIHDDVYWFPDGSIVLVAQNRAFRVYHGILMMQSPIFRDLLSLPQPHHAAKVEGCPVVHLEDSAADVQELVHFLFDRR